ncbi:MAG: hypothetical protein Q9216_001513 [Gyalolechia sp. 2 TL-2023]
MASGQDSEMSDVEPPGQSASHFTPEGQVKLKIPVDSAWVKGRLHMYGLRQDDVKALDRYPDFEKQVTDILKRKRDSDVSSKEQKSFTVAHRKFKGLNEDTFLCQLMPFLANRERLVPQSLVDRAGVEEDEVQVSVDFVESGLMTVANREFSRSLPWIFDGDKELNKSMKKDAYMSNPKPDRTFAVDTERFPWPPNFVVSSRIVALTDVVRSTCHPFAVWEGRSDRGDLVGARNQACRAGAVLQYWDRRLREELGQPDVVGPDPRTFVFSIVSSPEIIEVHVNWVEVPADRSQEPLYHMNRLRTKALADEEGLGPIRKLINNVLGWGIGTRFDGLVGLHKEIIAYARNVAKEEKEVAAAVTATAAKEKQSPKKKQKTV